MRKLHVLFLVAVAAMLAACNHVETPSQKHFREQRRLAPTLIRSIQEAKEVEIIAIDPKHPTSISYVFPDQPRALDRWALVGRKKIASSSDIRELAASLNRAIRRGDGSYTLCFDPHHGLRFMDEGKEVLVIVCFDCFFVEIYGIDGLDGVDLAINSPDELATWNRIFKKHGLPASNKANLEGSDSPQRESGPRLNKPGE